MFKNSSSDHFLQELLKQLPKRDSITGANTFYILYIIQIVLSPPFGLAGTEAGSIRFWAKKNIYIEIRNFRTFMMVDKIPGFSCIHALYRRSIICGKGGKRSADNGFLSVTQI